MLLLCYLSFEVAPASPNANEVIRVCVCVRAIASGCGRCENSRRGHVCRRVRVRGRFRCAFACKTGLAERVFMFRKWAQPSTCESSVCGCQRANADCFSVSRLC